MYRIGMCAVLAASLAAEDVVAPVAVIDDQAAASVAAEPTPRWKTTGKTAVFVTNVATANADTSRDEAIAGTTASTGYRLAFDGLLEFREGKQSVDQRIVAKYGRNRDQGEDWTEDSDEVRYDGVYRYSFKKPHFAYVDWGWESVFTGPDPDNALFQPGTVKASTGYGQLYENLLPKTDKLEARIGVGVQQQYGDTLSDYEKELETGLQAYLRYERKQNETLSYWAQYEGFSEFSDMAHVKNLITAGLTVAAMKYVSIDLGLRMYYESRPDDVPDSDPGYNQWSLTQDTLVGLTYIW